MEAISPSWESFGPSCQKYWYHSDAWELLWCRINNKSFKYKCFTFMRCKQADLWRIGDVLGWLIPTEADGRWWSNVLVALVSCFLWGILKMFNRILTVKMTPYARLRAETLLKLFCCLQLWRSGRTSSVYLLLWILKLSAAWQQNKWV